MLPGQEYIITLIFLVLTALAGLNSMQSKILFDGIKTSTHLTK